MSGLENKKPPGFLGEVERMLDFKLAARSNLTRVTVAVTEKTARKRLRIKKSDPIIYKGIELNCIGTRAWRLKQQQAPMQESI